MLGLPVLSSLATNRVLSLARNVARLFRLMIFVAMMVSFRYLLLGLNRLLMSSSVA